MTIRYHLMKLFYYCFIYSCPKGAVRETYRKMFKDTKDYIVNVVNETKDR